LTMSEPLVITEEQNLQEQWYLRAKEATLETLPEFIRHLMNDYQHDYGTVCHAIAASAVAAAWAAERQPQGGITGFQASAIAWEFLGAWSDIKAPARIVQYKEMLYPQMSDKFQKVITAETWEWLQARAREHLAELPKQREEARAYYEQRLQEFRAALEAGEATEEDRPEYWEPVAESVVEHWESIVAGTVPFGYVVRES
jgi:hypothetical protein